MKHGDKTKQAIMNATLQLWADDPVTITTRAIATVCNVTHGSILYHFGTIEGLKTQAAKQAVEIGRSRVIAQLIATRHAAVANMDAKTRRMHLFAADQS